MTTLAGNGLCIHANGTGAAAAFQQPNSLALNAGTLYVADSSSVRKVTSAGVVSTFVGEGLEIGGNGALAFDTAGILYVADTYNHVIRKITQHGVMTTVIGMPLQIGIALGIRCPPRWRSRQPSRCCRQAGSSRYSIPMRCS